MGALQMEPPQNHLMSSSNNAYMNGFVTTDPGSFDPGAFTATNFYPHQPPSNPPQMSNAQCMQPPPPLMQQQPDQPPGLYPNSSAAANFYQAVSQFGTDRVPLSPFPPRPEEESAANAQQQQQQQMALIAQSLQLFAAAINGGVPRMPTPTSNNAGFDPFSLQQNSIDPNGALAQQMGGYTQQAAFTMLDKFKVCSLDAA